ncbi:YhbY family RNA-binding protein [Acetobacterium tundrae]|uniref:RNA-binding protein n=1 Tax=Acetobacterium tundrae TaxID=132932 RepID=A0ABR6WN95_9FIRM|nr:YhbY family RNA-binding protein [Acetobacterium tundrae]MBC3797972.1 RNA-binding protein [Acetobacterium tundrae]
MLTSKQRSYLKKLAIDIPDIIFIGKDGITPQVIIQTRDAIVARELVKGKVQNNSLEEVDNVAKELAMATKSDIVCTIGNKFILYKKNLLKTKIEVPSKNQKKIKRFKKKTMGTPKKFND